MIRTTSPLSQPPLKAEDHADSARLRGRRLLAVNIALSLLIAGAAIASGMVTQMPAFILPAAMLVLLATVLAMWNFPHVTLYMAFGSACVIEAGALGFPDSVTDQIPLFWNINTVVQHYAHSDFKALPISLFELFLLVTAVGSTVRAVFFRRVSLRAGNLLTAILPYIGFVMIGWINGMATGGDFKIALQEVRPQFYFLIAYLMAVNLVKEWRQLDRLLYIAVIGIGIKGILWVFRRYVTLAGQQITDQGVGSHEEAFFFDVFVVLFLTLKLYGVRGNMRRVMFLLLPTVILGNLATNRRAGTAALAIVVPILMLAAERGLPERRKMIRIVAAVMAVFAIFYYQIFKDSSSIIAQPARAIHAQFEPDPRDASSDAYRVAEDQDLMATVKVAPIQGYGYGKHMLHVAPIADISQVYEWWDIMTHDQILWVWMRVGTFGFFAFWMMVAAIIVNACRIIRNEELEPDVKAIATFCLLVICMLMIFGLLDLQLSNFRDMLFAGFSTGILSALPQLGPVRTPRTAVVTKPQSR